MTGFNHALTGAAIGLAVQQPLLVIPLAFLSHFILDSLPHFDHPLYTFGSKHAWKLYIIDALIAVTGVILTILYAPALLLPITLGAVFAVLPDATLVHYYTKGKPSHWFHNFHLGVQWFEKPIGILVEAAYLVFITTAIAAQIVS
jgi:Na+-transporting methylmalonyl-CoA/oxaloacetate decarboxylase beta subunit